MLLLLLLLFFFLYQLRVFFFYYKSFYYRRSNSQLLDLNLYQVVHVNYHTSISVICLYCISLFARQVAGDGEGGIEMTESMVLIRNFCDRFVDSDKATRTRIVIFLISNLHLPAFPPGSCYCLFNTFSHVYNGFRHTISKSRGYKSQPWFARSSYANLIIEYKTDDICFTEL